MDEHALLEVVGVIGLFALVISVIVVSLVQVGATVRARAALAREQEYRKLAEVGAQTQQNIEARLDETVQRLAAMEERLKAMEKILQTVE
ncbi:hypothetical protein [Bailinhaonella thermotolerans]|uniref:Uncharacterized protein n=1 Tax=Bailinhaonella thermotolerans TaxID=1070861 RepID=A0A3A4BJE1_9ACTN|nr:hypothetical protein [Bailinhaonella thermotolerans]RJL35354.1 hypothetical protein D5H75_00560 [Bailinhaonella thermotolerans]